MRGRAWRRAQYQRQVDRARHIVYDVWQEHKDPFEGFTTYPKAMTREEWVEHFSRVMATTRPLCSCEMGCGNRRTTEGPSISERRRIEQTGV